MSTKKISVRHRFIASFLLFSLLLQSCHSSVHYDYTAGTNKSNSDFHEIKKSNTTFNAIIEEHRQDSRENVPFEISNISFDKKLIESSLNKKVYNESFSEASELLTMVRRHKLKNIDIPSFFEGLLSENVTAEVKTKLATAVMYSSGYGGVLEITPDVIIKVIAKNLDSQVPYFLSITISNLLNNDNYKYSIELRKVVSELLSTYKNEEFLKNLASFVEPKSNHNSGYFKQNYTNPTNLNYSQNCNLSNQSLEKTKAIEKIKTTSKAHASENSEVSTEELFESLKNRKKNIKSIRTTLLEPAVNDPQGNDRGWFFHNNYDDIKSIYKNTIIDTKKLKSDDKDSYLPKLFMQNKSIPKVTLDRLDGNWYLYYIFSDLMISEIFLSASKNQRMNSKTIEILFSALDSVGELKSKIFCNKSEQEILKALQTESIILKKHRNEPGIVAKFAEELCDKGFSNINEGWFTTSYSYDNEEIRKVLDIYIEKIRENAAKTLSNSIKRNKSIINNYSSKLSSLLNDNNESVKDTFTKLLSEGSDDKNINAKIFDNHLNSLLKNKNCKEALEYIGSYSLDKRKVKELFTNETLEKLVDVIKDKSIDIDVRKDLLEILQNYVETAEKSLPNSLLLSLLKILNDPAEDSEITKGVVVLLGLIPQKSENLGKKEVLNFIFKALYNLYKSEDTKISAYLLLSILSEIKHFEEDEIKNFDHTHAIRALLPMIRDSKVIVSNDRDIEIEDRNSKNQRYSAVSTLALDFIYHNISMTENNQASFIRIAEALNSREKQTRILASKFFAKTKNYQLFTREIQDAIDKSIDDSVGDVMLNSRFAFLDYMKYKSQNNDDIGTLDIERIIDLYNFESFIVGHRDFKNDINELIIDILENESKSKKIKYINTISDWAKEILCRENDSKIHLKILKILESQINYGSIMPESFLRVLEDFVENNAYGEKGVLKISWYLIKESIRKGQFVSERILEKISDNITLSRDTALRQEAFDLLSIANKNQIIESENIFSKLELERAAHCLIFSKENQENIIAFLEEKISNNIKASPLVFDALNSLSDLSEAVPLLTKIVENGQAIPIELLQKLEDIFESKIIDKDAIYLFNTICLNHQTISKDFIEKIELAFNSAKGEDSLPFVSFLLDALLKGHEIRNSLINKLTDRVLKNNDKSLMSKVVQIAKSKILSFNKETIKSCKQIYIYLFKSTDKRAIDDSILGIKILSENLEQQIDKDYISKIYEIYKSSDLKNDTIKLKIKNLLEFPRINNLLNNEQKSFLNKSDHRPVQRIEFEKYKKNNNLSQSTLPSFSHEEERDNLVYSKEQSETESIIRINISDLLSITTEEEFIEAMVLLDRLKQIGWKNNDILSLTESLKYAKTKKTTYKRSMPRMILKTILDYKISSYYCGKICTELEKDSRNCIPILNEIFIEENFSPDLQPTQRTLKEILEVFAKENRIESQEKISELEKDINKIKNKKFCSNLAGNFVYNIHSNKIFLSSDQISNWNEQDINNWAKLAEKSSLFKEHDFIVEAITIAARAYEILENKNLRDPQILALLSLLCKDKFDELPKGKLLQISTGEGKSTIISMVALVNALMGKNVDIITTTSVLAERDAKEKSSFYKIFGVECSHNDEREYIKGSKNCYAKKIVYGSIDQFKFDLLRDEYSQLGTLRGRKGNFVIVDEADSMMIEEGASTAKLSSHIPGMDYLKPLYFFIKEKLLEEIESLKNCRINEDIDKKIIENISNKLFMAIDKKEIFLPKHLINFTKNQVKSYINNGLVSLSNETCVLMRDYVIEDGKITPVSYNTTGMVQRMTSWCNGLQQFLQIKHGLNLTSESINTNYKSNFDFIKSYGSELVGVTGTLGSQNSKQFLQDSYDVNLTVIPRFCQEQYYQLPDKVSCDGESWLENICDAALTESEKNRGILVICESIKEAQAIHKKLSKHTGGSSLKLYTINGKNQEKDIQKIKPGEIIVATNLASRGTDIDSKEVQEYGGLHVIETFLPQNQRVEDQAFGRTSRQGARGSGQMILNFEKIKHLGNVSSENVRAIRDKYEEDLIFKQKEVLTNVELKESLFKRFCKKFNEIKDALHVKYASYYSRVKGQIYEKGEIQKTIEEENIISAIEERWGFFLKEIENEPLSMNKADEKYENFENDLFINFEKDPYRVIENPSYLINIANNIVFNNPYLDETFDKAAHLYKRAISLDNEFSGAAYLGLAWLEILGKKRIFLSNDRNATYKDESRKNIQLGIEIIQKELQSLSKIIGYHSRTIDQSNNLPLMHQIKQRMEMLKTYLDSWQGVAETIKISQRLLDINVTESESCQEKNLSKFHRTKNYFTGNENIFNKIISYKEMHHDNDEIEKNIFNNHINAKKYEIIAKGFTKTDGVISDGDQAQELIDKISEDDHALYCRKYEFNVRNLSQERFKDLFLADKELLLPSLELVKHEIENSKKIKDDSYIEAIGENNETLKKVNIENYCNTFNKSKKLFGGKEYLDEVLEKFSDVKDKAIMYKLKFKDINKEGIDKIESVLMKSSLVVEVFGLDKSFSESLSDITCKNLNLDIVGTPLKLLKGFEKIDDVKKVSLHGDGYVQELPIDKVISELKERHEKNAIICVKVSFQDISQTSVEKIFNLYKSLDEEEEKEASREEEKGIQNKIPILTHFGVRFNQLDETNTNLESLVNKFDKIPLSLSIDDISKNPALKLIEVLRDHNHDFSISIKADSQAEAEKIIKKAHSALQEEEILTNNTSTIAPLFAKNDICEQEALELSSRGIQYTISANERKHIPWTSIAFVGGLAASEALLGVGLIMTGAGGYAGMGLLTDALAEILTIRNIYTSRQFSTKMHLASKSVSLLLMAATLGAGKIKDAYRGSKNLLNGTKELTKEYAENKLTNQVFKKITEIESRAFQSAEANIFATWHTAALTSLVENIGKSSLNSLADVLVNYGINKFKPIIESAISAKVGTQLQGIFLKPLLMRLQLIEKLTNSAYLKSDIEKIVNQVINPQGTWMSDIWNGVVKPLSRGILSSKNLYEAMNCSDCEDKVKDANWGIKLANILHGIYEINTVVNKIFQEILRKLSLLYEEKYNIAEIMINSKIMDQKEAYVLKKKLEKDGIISIERDKKSGYYFEKINLESLEKIKRKNEGKYPVIIKILEGLSQSNELEEKYMFEEIHTSVTKSITNYISQIIESKIIPEITTYINSEIVNYTSGYLQDTYLVSDEHDSENQIANRPNREKYKALKKKKYDDLNEDEKEFLENYNYTFKTFASQFYGNVDDYIKHYEVLNIYRNIDQSKKDNTIEENNEDLENKKNKIIKNNEPATLFGKAILDKKLENEGRDIKEIVLNHMEVENLEKDPNFRNKILAENPNGVIIHIPGKNPNEVGHNILLQSDGTIFDPKNIKGLGEKDCRYAIQLKILGKDITLENIDKLKSEVCEFMKSHSKGCTEALNHENYIYERFSKEDPNKILYAAGCTDCHNIDISFDDFLKLPLEQRKLHVSKTWYATIKDGAGITKKIGIMINSAGKLVVFIPGGQGIGGVMMGAGTILEISADLISTGNEILHSENLNAALLDGIAKNKNHLFEGLKSALSAVVGEKAKSINNAISLIQKYDDANGNNIKEAMLIIEKETPELFKKLNPIFEAIQAGYSCFATPGDIIEGINTYYSEVNKQQAILDKAIKNITTVDQLSALIEKVNESGYTVAKPVASIQGYTNLVQNKAIAHYGESTWNSLSDYAKSQLLGNYSKLGFPPIEELMNSNGNDINEKINKYYQNKIDNKKYSGSKLSKGLKRSADKAKIEKINKKIEECLKNNNQKNFIFCEKELDMIENKYNVRFHEHLFNETLVYKGNNSTHESLKNLKSDVTQICNGKGITSEEKINKLIHRILNPTVNATETVDKLKTYTKDEIERLINTGSSDTTRLFVCNCGCGFSLSMKKDIPTILEEDCRYSNYIKDPSRQHLYSQEATNFMNENNIVKKY